MGNQQQMWCCFHNRSEVSLCDWFWFVASCRQPRWLETNTRPQSSVEVINLDWQNSWKSAKCFPLSVANDLKTNVPFLTYQEIIWSFILCCCYQMAPIKLNSFLYLGRVGLSSLVIPFKGVWPIYGGESPQGSLEHLLGKLFRNQYN